MLSVLNKFLFRYRSTPHSTTNSSPAELFLKQEFRTVLDLLRPDSHDASHKARTRYQFYFNRHTKERQFNEGDKVLVRDFRAAADKVKWTAGTLIHRSGSCVWSVKVENKIWRRHENKIKIRKWSQSEDFLLLDPVNSNTNEEIETPQDNPPVNQDSHPLRRSSRVRQPVRRLIEEI